MPRRDIAGITVNRWAHGLRLRIQLAVGSGLAGGGAALRGGQETVWADFDRQFRRRSERIHERGH